MTELKRPIGIASLLAEIGRNPDVSLVEIRRFDTWKWIARDIGDRGGSEAVARQAQATLLLAGAGIPVAIEVASLTIAEDTAVSGGAVVTSIDLRVTQEYRHVAIVVEAIRGEGVS